jgi:hypothetical protein
MGGHQQAGASDPSYTPRQIETYYILQSSELAVSWKLVFIPASAVLTACRLPDDFGYLDVAIWFAQRGVPFRIFHPCQNLSLTHPPFGQFLSSAFQ